MLKNTKAFSGFSVKDPQKAKEFYEKKLGLNVEQSPEGLVLHLAGDVDVFIYESHENEAAEFTILNFVVDSVDKEAAELSKKGVKFEQYEGMFQTNEHGVFETPSHVKMGPKKMAWFKDPSGNLFSLLEMR